jgi:hypothetical protein
MDDQFWKSGPKNSMFFNDKHKEYHIHVWSDISSEYRENTRREFWDDVKEEIQKIFQPLKIDIDFNHEDHEEYLWLHIPEEGHEEKIKTIVSHLNTNQDQWYRHRFPKLELLVKRKLQSKRFLTQSIIEYQHKHGYETVKAIVDKYGFLLFSHNI